MKKFFKAKETLIKEKINITPFNLSTYYPSC